MMLYHSLTLPFDLNDLMIYADEAALEHTSCHFHPVSQTLRLYHVVPFILVIGRRYFVVGEVDNSSDPG